MSDTESKPVPLRDRITVQVNGINRELLMSFGLLNECTEVISDLPRVSLLPMDAVMRGGVLMSVLSVRNTDGVIVQPFNPFSSQISAEDVVKVLTWVSEHTLSFFLQAIEQNLQAHSVHQKALSSMASGDGLKTSR